MLDIVNEVNLLDATPSSSIVTKHSIAIAADKFGLELILPSPKAALKVS